MSEKNRKNEILWLRLIYATRDHFYEKTTTFQRPGRGLGLSIVGRKNEPGVYVSEVVKGGAAEAEGTLITGDQVSPNQLHNLTSYMRKHQKFTL